MGSVLCEERFLDTLVEISSLITAGLDRKMTFSKVLSCALEVLDAEAVFLITLESGLVVKYAKRKTAGATESAMERYERSGERGIAWWVMKEAKPVLIPGVWRDHWLGKAEEGATPPEGGGCLCAPLKARETVLGVLIAVNKLGTGSFSESDLSVLSVLANQTAIAIENANLYNKVHQLSLTDELTQVFNFRFLKERLREELERAARFQQSFSILMLDVDHLKKYNDSFGHLKGSTVLKDLAGIMKMTVRSIDLVAKYGGDEFLVILPQTPKEGAMVLAERIRAAVACNVFPEVDSGAITCSIGVSTYPEDGCTVGALLESADGALYQAKQAGRNSVRCAVPRVDDQPDAPGKPARGKDVCEELMR